MIKSLSPAQCILLAVHYASSANIQALHSFTPLRPDALVPELILRIILTYLPESTEPRDYITYVSEVASRLYLDVSREDVEVDVGPVKDISEEEAQRKVKKLQLLKLRAPSYPVYGPRDLLTRFLCHRTYRIDSETGLLNLVPSLVEPFLERNLYLRTWYISVVLPMLRYHLELYEEADQAPSMSLTEFEKLRAPAAINFLLDVAVKRGRPEEIEGSSEGKDSTIARDTKSLVGPWMYGYTERKRRRLGPKEVPFNWEENQDGDDDKDSEEEADDLADGVHKIALTGVTEDDITGHDWEYLFRWLVLHARDNFDLTARCMEDWDGPGDVDLGDFSKNPRDYLDEEIQRKLELQYAQAGFASCYAAQGDNKETVECAHGILARLAELLDFIPPPDLASSIDLLPKIERHALKLDESQNVSYVEPDKLLTPEHPLTTPKIESYMLLQLMVYSAYQFAGLGHPISLVNVAKLHFYAPAEEQVDVIRKILRGLSKSGARKDDNQWEADRAKLIWLWNWGIDAEDDDATTGAGVLGKIDKSVFEEEMLRVFTETACYQLAIRLFLSGKNPNQTTLSHDAVLEIVLSKAMEAYDSASNGNKTRGGVKKASDIIAAFRPSFPDSSSFREATALIAATHSLSYYSLTLQHGVPFQPVSIRVNHDPLGLIETVLEQNPRSYTKLDDLIGIAKNLVAAGLHGENSEDSNLNKNLSRETLEHRRKEAERRVTFMGVQAALREEDFETAYSFIVNRLTPPGADITAPSTNEKPTSGHSRHDSKGAIVDEDDVSWRAAFLAGRYRPATNSPPTVRRLEQRTELLSLALLLAPKSALTEILAAWRRCEEEMTTLQASQLAEEEEFDDRADRRQPTSALPGNFIMGGDVPEIIPNHKRREMGRMASSGAHGRSDAPMSMFDLTRSAARAFSQGALGSSSGSPAVAARPPDARQSMDANAEGDHEDRVRKRDYVANAVSGGLASGLGWVLGATPQQHEEK